MPIYLYLDDRDDTYHEIIQSMKEKHVAFAKDGYQLKRVFVNPQANIGSTSKLDPFDSKAYVNLTSSKKGTIGNLEDLSKELSSKREEKLGHTDPVKQKFYNDYAKKRGGKRCSQERKETVEKLTKEVDLKIKI